MTTSNLATKDGIQVNLVHPCTQQPSAAKLLSMTKLLERLGIGCQRPFGTHRVRSASPPTSVMIPLCERKLCRSLVNRAFVKLSPLKRRKAKGDTQRVHTPPSLREKHTDERSPSSSDGRDADMEAPQQHGDGFRYASLAFWYLCGEHWVMM